MILKRDKFFSFKNRCCKSINNDFLLKWKKNYNKGNKFDASNLLNISNEKNEKNIFKKINNNIEIDFKNIKVPMSEKLKILN